MHAARSRTRPSGREDREDAEDEAALLHAPMSIQPSETGSLRAHAFIGFACFTHSQFDNNPSRVIMTIQSTSPDAASRSHGRRWRQIRHCHALIFCSRSGLHIPVFQHVSKTVLLARKYSSGLYRAIIKSSVPSTSANAQSVFAHSSFA